MGVHILSLPRISEKKSIWEYSLDHACQVIRGNESMRVMKMMRQMGERRWVSDYCWLSMNELLSAENF